ncbi:tRNA (N6-threonylcarbamoyladenosine(37)-N6)-methyltransferase TrmO [Chloroflexota bacterium]
MTNELSALTHKVIGVVRNELNETGSRSDIQDIVSEVELYDSYADGLYRLNEYSHVIVLYQFHIDRHPGPKPVKQHAHNQESYPLVGIFALRGSNRPNRIGIGMVKILEVSGNKLKVSGLDAVDGSPVIDIKPYISRMDSIPDAKVSSWESEWEKR